jgi:nitrogen regulatory protein P-II 1
MKRIDAVIRREQFEAVKRALDAIECPGMMVFMIRGHGRQGGVVETFKGRRYKIELLPKALLTIFANDRDVKKITSTIVRSAKTGRIGDGKIFVTPAEDVIRIRTGEKGSGGI